MSSDAMLLRTQMAAEGWESEDRLTRVGWGATPGYSIWFRRADWHGKRALVLTGDFAKYHAHIPDPARAGEAVHAAAALARRAWTEFPDCPPRQQGRSLIMRNPMGAV